MIYAYQPEALVTAWMCGWCLKGAVLWGHPYPLGSAATTRPVVSGLSQMYRTPRWCPRTGWCVENAHIWCQKGSTEVEVCERKGAPAGGVCFSLTQASEARRVFKSADWTPAPLGSAPQLISLPSHSLWGWKPMARRRRPSF